MDKTLPLPNSSHADGISHQIWKAHSHLGQVGELQIQCIQCTLARWNYKKVGLNSYHNVLSFSLSGA